jgi:hypothetical protein
MFFSATIFGRDPIGDKDSREYMSIEPQAQPDRYKKAPVVNPQTGQIEMTPIISESARN